MLNANALRTMAELLDEAAGHLRAVMESGLAEQRQVRHFLPDELEGLAIMLREQAANGVPPTDFHSRAQALRFDGFVTLGGPFHCARDGICDATPRCTRQCAACADGALWEMPRG